MSRQSWIRIAIDVGTLVIFQCRRNNDPTLAVARKVKILNSSRNFDIYKNENDDQWWWLLQIVSHRIGRFFGCKIHIMQKSGQQVADLPHARCGDWPWELFQANLTVTFWTSNLRESPLGCLWHNFININVLVHLCPWLSFMVHWIRKWSHAIYSICYVWNYLLITIRATRLYSFSWHILIIMCMTFAAWCQNN